MSIPTTRDVVASRRALYELARRLPAVHLAPLLGVSDVRLGRILEQHEIPHHWRGNWEKAYHRGLTPQLRFRPAPGGVSEIVRFGARAGERAGRRDEELVRLLRLDVEAPPPDVPESVRDAHALARRGASAVEWSHHLGPTNLPRAVADYMMSVPKPQTPRAKRVLGALFASLELREMPIRVDRRRAHPRPKLRVLGVDIDLHLQYVRVPHGRHVTAVVSGTSRQDEPLRDLVLTARAVGTASGGTWGAYGRQRLEHRLGEVPAGIIAIAAEARQRR